MATKRGPAIVCTIVILALVAYVVSYALLSRSAFRDADRQDLEGFYFCSQHSHRDYAIHRTLARFYYPLIAIDMLTGFGREPAAEPMREME